MASNIDWRGKRALRSLARLYKRVDELKQRETDDAEYLCHRGLPNARNSHPRLKELRTHRKAAELELAHDAQGACANPSLKGNLGRADLVFKGECTALFGADETLKRRARSRLVDAVEGELQARGLI